MDTDNISTAEVEDLITIAITVCAYSDEQSNINGNSTHHIPLDKVLPLLTA